MLALVFNGLILGVVGGLAFGAGNGAAFLRLLSAHGPLELSCIVVGGVAGLRLGWAMIAPGPAARGPAVVAEARNAVELALGTAPWLVLCGLAEGFLDRPRPARRRSSSAIGVALFALFWGLVAWRGRARRAHEPRLRRLGAQVRGDAGAAAAARRAPRATWAPARRARARPRGVRAARTSSGDGGAGERRPRVRRARGERRRGRGRRGWRRRPRGGGRAPGIASTSGRAAASSSRSQRTSTNARLAPSTRRKASS